MNARRPGRMANGWRITLYTVFAALWISGCGWLALHFYFEPATDFGRLPHPLEPVLMRIHGLLAVPGIFLLGWLLSAHIAERWRQRGRIASGLTLATAAALLVIAGYALYYTTGRAHDVASVAHEAVGVAAIVMALTHWWRVNG